MFPTLEEFNEWMPALLGGLKVSVEVAAFSLVIGIPLGLLFALGVGTKSRFSRYVSLFLVEVGRGAPALVLLQFMYFGLPATGLTMTSFSAAVVALAWNTGAYTSEIIRASLQSIHHGQREAAEALGFNALDELRFVLLPQALRVALPALLGFAILIFQGTSLCFTIALPELVSNAYMIGSNTFRYMPALLMAGLLYAVICIPATWIVSYVENRSSAYTTR
ncbi:MAG: amino acid ABC transporter permease [Rhizobiales bacterium]|nr:amino acid ABC transporter permease [Hyphomicrobiales bacterium]OJX98592.1 MAG: amino acid ABC transporter permease [Rhizobiales bacterium 63-22]